MEHLILTETDFFRLIDNPGSTGLGTAYNEFTTTVVSLCKETESACRTVFALSYAETELQYHDAMQETDSSRSMYVRKALSFVRKMLKYYQVGLHRDGAFDGGEKTNQRQHGRAGGTDLRSGRDEAHQRRGNGHQGAAGEILPHVLCGDKREPVLQHLCGHQAAEEREPHLFLRQGCGEIEPADAGRRGTGTDAEKITRK